MLGFWNLQDRALERHMWAFGEPVILYPEGMDPAGYAVRGIFDTPPNEVGLGLTQPLSNQAPWVDFRVLELPDAALPEQGWQFEARAARWEIMDVQPDGSGQVRCRCFRIGPGSSSPLPPMDAPAPIPEPMPTTTGIFRESEWRSATWADFP